MPMLDDSMLGKKNYGEMNFSMQYKFEIEYGVKEANVFHIKLCLENHLTCLIFECLVVKFSLILTKVNNVD